MHIVNDTILIISAAMFVYIAVRYALEKFGIVKSDHSVWDDQDQIGFRS